MTVKSYPHLQSVPASAAMPLEVERVQYAGPPVWEWEPRRPLHLCLSCHRLHDGEDMVCPICSSF